MPAESVGVLILGDVVGSPGIAAAAAGIRRVKADWPVDLVVANGENADRGFGLTTRSYHALKDAGVDLITLGNHAWDKREIFEFVDHCEDLVRPANYPPGTPGRTRTLATVRGVRLGLFQLQGRAFMGLSDCPFRAADREIAALEDEDADLILVDVHAEASAEKQALARHMDGRVTAVTGSHTHVQTADERIFPSGTGYMGDVGMTGPWDSVVGMRPEQSLRRMREQLPVKFEVADGPTVFCAAWLQLDPASGRTLRIERIQHR
ncbi:MAG: TIGR00282 family metallophosphoesterase [Candidatus Sericytochromatia bacterium]|nr:TIGR00282 family metallophosphoesterase [Candidatus Sericytochromatia bacterium]